jgi:endonuclease/exonuclease/phosphatase family metal-dependent hydrolase
MSYNVELSGHAHERTLDAIALGDADVVLLQEPTRVWEGRLRSRFAEAYPHQRFHHPGRPAGGFAILSRVPIREDEVLPAAAGWFAAHRIVVDAPFGALQMLHVHLRPAWDGDWVTGFFTTPPIRRREIEAYWRALDPTLPTIVAGDFNEEVGPHGQALAYLHERALRRADTNGTPTWQWKGNVSGRPIHLRLTLDHILADSRLELRDAGVIDAGASDHKPVVATLVRRPASRSEV